MAEYVDKEAMRETIREQERLHGLKGLGWVEAAMDRLPTLTPPNEWVQVLEAINNEAVAYIEGGPYKNDLPGMELALKIDRLSRDFVRPPGGEEE